MLKYNLLLKILVFKFSVNMDKGSITEASKIRCKIRNKRVNLLSRILENKELRVNKLNNKLIKGDYLLYKVGMGAVVNDSNYPEVLDLKITDTVTNILGSGL